ncbi:MAG: NAD(P)-dependent glycerol-3-phosphate dehydrogenase, partial [Thermodesulfovibrionales bacterium]|nr:NAD(P)-dependent glycerol-3-phosphate dehydrogenase [Thermodesulfovibrionales bacterium]
YISVIGAGSWGTTLASLLADKGYDVVIWAREREVVDYINNQKENKLYLPGFILPESLKATNNLIEAVATSRYIINVVPTQYVRSVFSQALTFINKEAIVVSASKGIELNSHKTPSLILKELLNRQISVISGPSFAKEVMLKSPTAVTLATDDRKVGLMLQELFNTNYFRVYTHDDVIGVEIGAALKNVIAIAAGICDGLGLGNNARAALITRGIFEISRLGVRLKAKEITFFGLSGIGDLILTCTSMQSRNYTVGYRLGKGESLTDIMSKMKHVAEGISTAQAAYELSIKYGVEMPITEQVFLTLYGGKAPIDAVKDLMNRTLKREFYGYSTA